MPKTKHSSEEVPGKDTEEGQEEPTEKKLKQLDKDTVPLSLSIEASADEQVPLGIEASADEQVPLGIETSADEQCETCVDQPDTTLVLDNVSQNKNPNLWCVGGGEVSASGSGIWGAEHISYPSNFDFAVDDPMFWGPYLAERQWGTVREDYSENDNSWEHVSYEAATGHAYVSGEDGLLGVSDKCSLLCMSTALWNGKDPILKERLFGLTGIEGNHGEDVKELYYYLDSLPDHSYMRALYKYPHLAFPYTRLREENRNRGSQDTEFELTDTGIFDQGGHWDVQVEYAKTDRLGLACHLQVTNCGRHEETLHLVPQFWFRHVQKDEPLLKMASTDEPQMKADKDGTVRVKYQFGRWRLVFLPDPARVDPTLLFTDNKTPVNRDQSDTSFFTKDAFHQYIVHERGDVVNPLCTGTKCGAYYKLTIAAGSKTSVYWRIENIMNPLQMGSHDLVTHFANKRKEAADFYNKIFPKWTAEERNIGTQALAGLMWSKQYYIFDVKHWLRDYRRCSQNKGTKGRNCEWSHVRNHHILLMPDTWEFPWYAGWDLCISAVLFARYNSKFAKQQILTFLSDNYMHPTGQLPGCEFEMGDPNPPLQAWAVLQIFYKDGANDPAFLRKCLHRLTFNYTWWCNKEFGSTSTYGRGFMGMDNISVIDRSGALPDCWSLVQADCTGWMACFALWMLKIVVELGNQDLVYCDLVPKFLVHFLNIASALNRSYEDQGLWHEEDRFVYDVFHTPYGPQPIRLQSMSGLVPLLACVRISMKKHSSAALSFDAYISEYPQFLCRLNDSEVFLSVLSMPRIQSVLERVFNEEEFLGPYGIRSLSKVYEREPFSMQVGDTHLSVRYTPGESDSGAFGGNSNWRGPVWIFMNYLLLESLDVYVYRLSVFKCSLLVSMPNPTSELEKRLLKIFLPDQNGRRPVHGDVTRYSEDWRHLVLFYEFNHADSGRGCGASHQTGWTASIIEIIHRLHRNSEAQGLAFKWKPWS